MLNFVCIYCIMGMIGIWIALELGNSEAKASGISFQQMHNEAMKEAFPYSATPIAISTAFTIIFLIWFIFIPLLIYKVITTKNS